MGQEHDIAFGPFRLETPPERLRRRPGTRLASAVPGDVALCGAFLPYWCKVCMVSRSSSF
jgi:hypothetical protein